MIKKMFTHVRDIENGFDSEVKHRQPKHDVLGEVIVCTEDEVRVLVKEVANAAMQEVEKDSDWFNHEEYLTAWLNRTLMSLVRTTTKPEVKQPVEEVEEETEEVEFGAA